MFDPAGDPTALQVKLPAPSVEIEYPAVPPGICKLLILPNDTLAVFEKLTTPVALLTVNPVKLPIEVIFG